jgi:eukaryotic-like serine/threonine-protein kinase
VESEDPAKYDAIPRSSTASAVLGQVPLGGYLPAPSVDFGALVSLAAGTLFGRYEVIALIGAGGMGEVYRARDTRLNRDVAIKILPATFTDNAVRRARFEREAQAISRLNHPNICAVYDVGTQDGGAYLVMEYIEGESLADRLRRGPVPAPTALRLAIQIAAALDAAHRRGITHRDLKPANVIIAGELVKLVDFGLAKLQSDDVPADAALLESTISLTAERSVVGTLHYMAPEQLEGREVDQRTDVFAFGTVLHEMLTGRKAFAGSTDASVIAAILTADPPPVSSSATSESLVSPALDHVVRRALEKNPDERWQTARDVMNELRWILEGASGRTPAKLRKWGRPVARPAVAAVAVLSLAAGVALWKTDRPPIGPIHLSFLRPVGVELTNTGRPVLAISPDGGKVVFNAKNQLYLRRLDDVEAVPIAGTQGIGVQTPVFSPDGQWVAFFTFDTRELKKIPVDGGAAVTISPWPAESRAGNFGASWTIDDQILFATTDGVFQVPSKGGTLRKIVATRPGEVLYGPQMLPDGDHLLLTVTTATGPDRWDKGLIIAQSLSSGARTVIVEGGSDARYLETGHIVYAVGTTLYAVPVDIRSFRTLGPPVSVLRNIGRAVIPAVNTASAFVAISESGDLAYIPE